MKKQLLMKKELSDSFNREDPQDLLESLTLFSDVFMSKVFDHNIPGATLLQVLLQDPGLEAMEVLGQRFLNSPLVSGHNSRLDILAKDKKGRLFNVEVQRDPKGASFQRTRYYHALCDVHQLEAGKDYRELRDTYVIFITETDPIGLGWGVYKVKKTIEGTERIFDDGSYTIYVNGEYRGNDEIGKLIHDFHVSQPEEMYFETLRNSVAHYKREPEGKEEMESLIREFYSKEIAEAAEQARQEALKQAEKEFRTEKDKTVRVLLESGWTAEKIKEAVDLPVSHIEEMERAFLEESGRSPVKESFNSLS